MVPCFVKHTNEMGAGVALSWVRGSVKVMMRNPWEPLKCLHVPVFLCLPAINVW